MSSSAGVPDLTTYGGINMGPVLTPFYVGTVISLILSGITILQAWNYFPSKDRPFIQVIAAVMIVLDLASTGLIAQGTWYYVIPYYGSLLPLDSLVPTLSAECTISVVIILISQSYFTWQIFTVSRRGTFKYVICAIIMTFSITSFIGGLACSIIMVTDKAHVLADRSYRFAVSAGIAKGASSVTDIIATITFCWTVGLTRTGMKHTDSMIKTLISYIIQRGIVVTTIQTLFLLIFFITAQHTWWLSLHVNVTRLYANTFFAMLNGRDSLRAKGQQVFVSSGGSSDTYNTGASNSAPTFAIAQPDKTQMSYDEDNLNGIQIEKSTMISNV